MTRPAFRAAIEPRLLDVERAAAYCGVSPNTFRQWCPVRPIRSGARVLFDRKQIDQWLDKLGGTIRDSAGAERAALEAAQNYGQGQRAASARQAAE